jgi:molybdate transport system regulatory protein
MPATARLKIKTQLMLGDEIALGPGKAELLEWIDRAGSISAAAKGMGLSYRRAWLMVDTMNRCFKAPLVSAAHGGAKGGGASLTNEGRSVLSDYRALVSELANVTHLASQRLAARLASAGS